MNLKTVYYRGLLRSCNYSCNYCPFRKGVSDLTADEAALCKFCEKTPDLGDGLTVMFVPYGEALIHNYYHKAIAKLCKNDSIKTVSCQTNLSFDVDKFSEEIDNYVNKISLWCTFHPSQTNIDGFLRQCEKLMNHNISFCVGAVGNPHDIDILKELRAQLPQNIYMWINSMDGMNRRYRPDEIQAFEKIDPLFHLELKDWVADTNCCVAGLESVFVEGSGDFSACNISRVKLGNLYDDLERIPAKICQAKKCHCYLAYSNRIEMWDILQSTESVITRKPNIKKAIFFDVDGTLTDETGQIPIKNIQAVERLSKSYIIFAATSLPYSYARQTCEPVWRYLSGGVFAEGSDVRIFDGGYKNIVPLDENAIEIIPDNVRYTRYHEEGILHKITVTGSVVFPDNGNFHIVYAGNIAGIVSKDAGKLNGVLKICWELKLLNDLVTVVGDSANDVPMLEFFHKSVAVPNAEVSAKNAAKIVCGVYKIR